MIRFECDSCRRLKEPGEDWILGFAAESIGVVSARREISIADVWDRPRAVEALAVHFCSNKCRARYVNDLFSEVPDTRSGERTVIKRRVKRAAPDAVVDTVVAEKTRPKIVRRTTVRRKAV
jgi:hypothetical protein